VENIDKPLTLRDFSEERKSTTRASKSIDTPSYASSTVKNQLLLLGGHAPSAYSKKGGFKPIQYSS